MQLGGVNLVDNIPIIQYYEERGLDTTLLRKCNTQEFRMIDGYGKGHFLTTTKPASETVGLTIDSKVASLKVIETLLLETPEQTGTKLYLVITAEPKYLLKDTLVDRNYNVTIDKSLNTYGATTIHTLAPDLTPKTLQQIITDFCPGSVNYSAQSLTPFDVDIEGMTAFDAIDHLCSIYGLVWDYDGSTTYIYRLPATKATIDTPYIDYHDNDIDPEISDIHTVFPIYDYCRQDPSEFYTVSNNTGAQGHSVKSYDPYYPCVVDKLGNPRNNALLDARSAEIVDNIRRIYKTIDFTVKRGFHASAIGTTPKSLSEIHGDYGEGPTSVYRSIRYPLAKTPRPGAHARYANNWIGQLTDGYFGKVAYFTVTPFLGLDGKIPPGVQSVRNIYNWDYGEPGWNVRVEWDCENGQWLALQQEYDCPPTEDPEYGTTPTTDPYPLPE